MSTEVHFLVDLTIHEGKLDGFESIVQDMVATTRQEAGALRYEWYLSTDRKRCRIVETYADADAVLAHLTGRAVQEGVPKMLQASSLDRFEVYGDPGAKAAAILAGFGAAIFAAWRGFTR
ncbi:MAG: putative quinol monooxygenase [Candidatus Korobacteraceae bacterium]